MEAIELVMKIWNIPDEYRPDIEEHLKTTPPEHLGLVLLNYGAPEDNEFTIANDEWIETYLPNLRFV